MLWRHYYSDSKGLVFVVDSSDRSRIDDATEELKRMLYDEELENVKILIFANK